MRAVSLSVVLLVLSLCALSAQATMVLNSSRVIIQEGQHEASFGIRNLDEGKEFLAQSWLTPLEGIGEVEFFSLTPQLVQVNAGAEQRVRILYEGVGLPDDRESLFWLNVQEIPKKLDGDHAVQIAVLQRIKVFYRPKGIKGNAMKANSEIEWSLVGDGIEVSNPSAFYVSVINVKSGEIGLRDVLIVGPGEKIKIELKKNQLDLLAKNSKKISYAVVNDYGAHDKYQIEFDGHYSKKGSDQ
ncbi:fimbrial biogenesis chaperone [Alcaligenes aquatilis]|jgi:P pilus assembly chaperone PapD